LKNLIKVVSAVLLMAVLTTGCAVNRATASVDAGAKLDTLKTFHVKRLEKDERGIDKLIAENLRTRGYQVTTGQQVPAQVDATVTYVDKWMWDITMYMLELTINFREPKTDFPLATGNSFHTSLTRKSPPEMVDEVVGNILKEGKAKK
jgi:hypothetical protein